MSFNCYSPITNLKPLKIKWCIRVRVQAVWKGITRETKEFRGINLILVDDSVRSNTACISVFSFYYFFIQQNLLNCAEIAYPCFCEC